ncbi:cobalamin biosynthesis protein [Agrobacterium rosae]|uniref:Cobalamin biosynthesis protein n=1 Tax=Agrobacterium rosae TaxID=1972867 RepID=A0AAE5RU68_9HYPH|nr:cobalamin biosynthesis protein [Agrobacterium rosae]KAA3510550.1 cobalamin biosynthesis protein [Agrobacterium rosae]KAA3517268.1 cobalamin biosynthesis protein [Agrobacterium rosae]MCM2434731.1 cobalamin biosynthesis protein [Agrobacterium rosae]MDX8330273.1 cobalamin biosynthesis protein [Agrobacterium rosae]MQB50012.1 cobalamin biosynthesis protein [Agrobacterium rosae]
MGLGQAVIVAGIGCRKGTSAEAIIAALDEASKAHGVKIDFIATAPIKADEPGLMEAATRLGMAFVVVAQADFEQAGARTITQSATSLKHSGSPSLSEASALAALGPRSRLIAPRMVIGDMTVALATLGDNE